MDTALDWVSLGIGTFLTVILIFLYLSTLKTNRITSYTRLFDIYTQVFKDRNNQLEERLKNPKNRGQRELTLKQIECNKYDLISSQSIIIAHLKAGKLIKDEGRKGKIAREIYERVKNMEDPVVQFKHGKQKVRKHDKREKITKR